MKDSSLKTIRESSHCEECATITDFKASCFCPFNTTCTHPSTQPYFEKQEANGPHCSHEKQFQSVRTFAYNYDYPINKDICV